MKKFIDLSGIHKWFLEEFRKIKKKTPAIKSCF